MRGFIIINFNKITDMRDDLMEAICEYLIMIPDGKVVTYGQIARWLGNPGLARVVGNLLHVNPDPEHYPCYKVVNAQGRLTGRFAFGGINVQKEKLEADGVEVSDDYRVDLKKFRWTQEGL